jgi:glucokinase
MNERTPRVAPADATRPLFAGIDVGGTNLKIGLVDDRGSTIADVKIPTEADHGPQDAVGRMARQIAALVEQAGLTSAEILAVGLATPGTMDLRAGLLLNPPNLPSWQNFPIRDCLAAACGKPVIFVNDANAAAYGEYWVGSGRDYPSIVLLTLGTGIGGGIIINGMSIDGEHSHGSECGHVLIDIRDDARLCPCGQRGHLEAYTSAKALVKRARELLDAGQKSSLSQRLASGARLTPLLLAEEAAAGDALSLTVIQEAAHYLALGIVSIAHTVDPAAVVLGGAMNFGGRDSTLGKQFLDTIREEFRRRAFPKLAEETVIDFAELGGDAGYIGAAGYAREHFQRTGPQACPPLPPHS